MQIRLEFYHCAVLKSQLARPISITGFRTTAVEDYKLNVLNQ